MNKKPKKADAATPPTAENPLPENEVIFHLPPGVKFSDIYMDAQQVALELNYSKRTINNMRKRGKLSFTTMFGKIYYLRQEIAAIFKANLKTVLWKPKT